MRTSLRLFRPIYERHDTPKWEAKHGSYTPSKVNNVRNARGALFLGAVAATQGAGARRPGRCPASSYLDVVVSPKHCMGCSAQAATSAALGMEAVSLVLRLLKLVLPVRAREPCTKTSVGETPIVSSVLGVCPSSSVASECILKLASAAKMACAPGSCSCASGATILQLRVARKLSLVLRL